jgi:hypothetical protein
MRIALELGKDLREVSDWPLDDLIQWEAFFRIKWKAEKEAIDKAKRGEGVRARRGVTVIED